MIAVIFIKGPKDLINRARFTIIDEYSKYTEINVKQNFHIILLIQKPKISGFQASKWYCYHIDDLQDDLIAGSVLEFKDLSLSKLLSTALDESPLSLNKNYFKMIVNLLRSIIFVACSKVGLGLVIPKVGDSYVDSNKIRAIQRIEILINLLHENKNENFSYLLIKMISKLQMQRENALSNSILSNLWIFN